MIFHDVEQNTDEWDNLRAKRIGFSSLHKVMANLGNTNKDGSIFWGEPAKKEAMRIANEILIGEPVKDDDKFYGQWMSDGHTNEELARIEYEAYRESEFITVSNGGFCESETIKIFGGSPDGRILSENAHVEIKCVKYTTQIETKRKGCYDRTHHWQLMANLFECGIDYIDFVSYCHTFPEGKRLFIDRLYPEEYKEETDKIEPRLRQFEQLIEEYIKIILS